MRGDEEAMRAIERQLGADPETMAVGWAPRRLLGLAARCAGAPLLEHSLRVCRGAGRVAGELGLAASEVERVRLAALLHDVGKSFVPRAILDKPGPLDDHEWAVVRGHPAAGAHLCRAHRLDAVADVVLAHHERPDGRGYPHGCRGSEIDLGARIVAVADAYDAMTCERSYRPRVGAGQAAAELRRVAGTQLDAGVVDAFLGTVGPRGRRAA